MGEAETSPKQGDFLAHSTFVVTRKCKSYFQHEFPQMNHKLFRNYF